MNENRDFFHRSPLLTSISIHFCVCVNVSILVSFFFFYFFFFSHRGFVSLRFSLCVASLSFLGNSSVSINFQPFANTCFVTFNTRDKSHIHFFHSGSAKLGNATHSKNRNRCGVRCTTKWESTIILLVPTTSAVLIPFPWFVYGWPVDKRIRVRFLFWRVNDSRCRRQQDKNNTKNVTNSKATTKKPIYKTTNVSMTKWILFSCCFILLSSVSISSLSFFHFVCLSLSVFAFHFGSHSSNMYEFYINTLSILFSLRSSLFATKNENKINSTATHTIPNDRVGGSRMYVRELMYTGINGYWYVCMCVCMWIESDRKRMWFVYVCKSALW